MVLIVQNWFGPDVQTIVEGETKFSKLGNLSSDSGSSVDVKARDLQHLFIAMTKEVCQTLYPNSLCQFIHTNNPCIASALTNPFKDSTLDLHLATSISPCWELMAIAQDPMCWHLSQDWQSAPTSLVDNHGIPLDGRGRQRSMGEALQTWRACFKDGGLGCRCAS